MLLRHGGRYEDTWLITLRHRKLNIATAIGLFAAIPAVVAYNRFSARSEMLIGRYYTFAEEFSSILHRRVHAREE